MRVITTILLAMEKARTDDSDDVLQPHKLPFELLDLIAQHAIRAAIGEKDTEIAKTCSLVFSGWRIPFQRALFKIKDPSLHFSDYASRREAGIIHELRVLLDANPSFQQAITSLSLRMLNSGTLPGSTSNFTCSLLSSLTSVDTLCFSQAHLLGGVHSWTRLTTDVQAALSVLFRSPSLQRLYIPSCDAPLAIMFPGGAELDIVDIRCSHSPDLEDNHLPDGSDLNDRDATKSQIASTRPCIVHHLKLAAPVAPRLLRATHGRRTDGMPIIDSSAIYSADLTMIGHGQLPDLRAALHGMHNLQKLILREPRWKADRKGLFQEPQPKCLATLEAIDRIFYMIDEPGILIKAVLLEFSVYPPVNNLKSVTMQLPFFRRRVFDLPSAEKLRDELLALAGLFGNTSRFPSLESVQVIPELEKEIITGQQWLPDREVIPLPSIIEEVMMELQKMPLGFQFTVRMSEEDIASFSREVDTALILRPAS